MPRTITEDTIKALAAASGIDLTDSEVQELLPQTIGLFSGLDKLADEGLTNSEPSIAFTPESE